MSIIIVFCALMSIIMGCAVVFDSTDGQKFEGMFVFRHKWVNWLCQPMLLIIPVLLMIFVAMIPLNISGVIENAIARGGLFILISMGLEFIFFSAVAVCLWFKYDLETKNSLNPC